MDSDVGFGVSDSRGAVLQRSRFIIRSIGIVAVSCTWSSISGVPPRERRESIPTMMRVRLEMGLSRSLIDLMAPRHGVPTIFLPSRIFPTSQLEAGSQPNSPRRPVFLVCLTSSFIPRFI